MALAPACVVQPQSAEDVSTAVSTLVQKEGSVSWCRFAIRGGGHTVWAGAAGIEDGVTIDLSLMKDAVYHPENKTASLLPGGRWRDVYNTLKEEGVSVTGGRTGSVGVSGFLLGGKRNSTVRVENFLTTRQVEIPFLRHGLVLRVTI